MKSMIIGAAIVAAFASPIAAQDMPGGVGRSGSVTQRMDAYALQERLIQNLSSANMEQQQDGYRDTQNPRRVRRAQEAAELINHGDCAGARTLALRANDQRLFARIEQVCSAQAATPAALSAAHQ